jgi:hypothetical protein
MGLHGQFSFLLPPGVNAWATETSYLNSDYRRKGLYRFNSALTGQVRFIRSPVDHQIEREILDPAAARQIFGIATMAQSR